MGTKRFKSFSHSLVASLGLFELGSLLSFFFFVLLSLSVSVSLFLSHSFDRRGFLCFASSFFVVFGLFCVYVLWAFLAFLFLGIDFSAVGF